MWAQCGGPNRKCIGNGVREYVVADRAECEQDALDEGHGFYQYVEEENMCWTVASCEDPVEGTGWDWRIYGEDCGITYYIMSLSFQDFIISLSIFFSKTVFFTTKNFRIFFPKIFFKKFLGKGS